MKLLFKLMLSVAVAGTVAASTTAHAAQADWKDLASGEHSFKSLGTDFYVDVPVRRMPNARIKLAFVNREAVKRLGLTLSDDPKETERMLLDLFAWEVDPEGKSPKKWFATHYQDSAEKGPGSAQGDGRALWTGELKLERPDGKILYVDGVQKGVGPTPYAWLNNKSHSDGRQNTNELVISSIRSMADMGNELDSTADLLGFTITDAAGDIRTMTLRVGRQTRPAHLRYFDDQPKNEKKMMDYIVNRDLGLPVNHDVSDTDFMQWNRNFAVNNAEDTARVFALQGFFEHPTNGNKTTTGGSIDLNGRQYLDAYHVNMTHLYGRLKVGDQVQLQKDYLHFMNGFLRKAGYRSNLDLTALTNQNNRLFDEKLKATASRLFLNSVGLSAEEIERVPENVRNEFYVAVAKLMRAEGNHAVDLYMQNENTIPAAFDTRKILRGTMAAYVKNTREQRAAAMAELYKVDYAWNTSKPGDHMELKAAYETAVSKLINSFGGRVRLPWISNAIRRNRPTRFDATSDGVWDDFAHPIRLKVEEGKTSWVDISTAMEKVAGRYIDADRPVRANAMLKPKVRLTAPSCRDLFSAAG